MGHFIVELLAPRFHLTREEDRLLALPRHELRPRERRALDALLERRRDAFGRAIRAVFYEALARDPQIRDRWATDVALRLLQQGAASAADRLAMDVVGRKVVERVLGGLKASRLLGPSGAAARRAP